MKPFFAFAIAAFLCSLSASSQHYLTQRGLNRVMNRAFGSLVTGQATSTQIANYASFDPVDGSFAFKGVIPVGNEDSGRISYLSLKLGGDLISNSYSALFSNSALNTNAFVQAEWNVHLFGHEPITYFRSDRVALQLKRELLMDEKRAKFSQVDTLLSRLQETVQSVRNNDIVLQAAKTRKATLQLAISARLTAIQAAATNVDSLKKYNDSLVKNRTAITSLETDIAANQQKLDSLDIIVRNNTAYRTILRRRIETDYNDKLTKLEDSASLTGLTFNWFTFSASVGKNKYFRYTATLPFSDQITKEEFSTHRFGIAWNFYTQSFFWRNAFYANIGFARVRENNASLLSTQEISQVRTQKNAAGDTTRTVTKKYNAYTDPIVEVNKGTAFVNLCYMFGLRTSGIHFYPELNFIDGGETLTNIGVGYVMSFINTAKDKPVINAEAYVNFLDVANKQEGKAKFWNRNEIGVRLTLPFTFLLK